MQAVLTGYQAYKSQKGNWVEGVHVLQKVSKKDILNGECVEGHATKMLYCEEGFVQKNLDPSYLMKEVILSFTVDFRGNPVVTGVKIAKEAK